MSAKRIAQCLSIMVMMTSPILVAKATPSAIPKIGDFHLTFNMGESWYEYSYGFGFVVMVYNPDDLGPGNADHMIPDVIDSEGNLLVDVEVQDGFGHIYSTSNGEIPDPNSQIYWNDPNNDFLWFPCGFGGIDKEDVPVGTYTATLRRLSDGTVLDTASFFTPYFDNDGNPTMPPPKFPQLIYPATGQTILDATPTFSWQYPSMDYVGEAFQFRLSAEWVRDAGWWTWNFALWNPSPKPLAVTFPDIPEYPENPPSTQAPEGMTFPLKLPVGLLYWSVIADEWFWGESIGGDPRCYFIVPYSTYTYFEVQPAVTLVPQILNLASNGRWITAHIEMPNGYSASEVDLSSIRINGVVPIDPTCTPEIGISDLTVKFDRLAVASLLENAANLIEDTGKFYQAQLTVSGTISGNPFSSMCTLRVIQK